MEFEHLAIQALAKEVRDEVFPVKSGLDVYTFVGPSAYDTAWVAMVSDPGSVQPVRPMFPGCLDWMMENQKEEGFWGECDAHGVPTIEAIPSTLACVIALKKWNLGTQHVYKGLEFIENNTEKMVGHHFPRWFILMFPAMLELAEEQTGFRLSFTPPFNKMMQELFHRRQRILESEELVDKTKRHPLMSYLETLPSTFKFSTEEIEKNLKDDGSLFRSPSATARAFILTGNSRCEGYLRSLAKHFNNGVPGTFPVGEELIKLCIVNHIQRMGLSKHFNYEINNILESVYRNYTNQDLEENPLSSNTTILYEKSLAFRMLRAHGYSVSPGMFCRFLNNKETREHIEKNHESFSNDMLSVYRATDLAFSGEDELEDARNFSRNLLQKSCYQRMIEDELSVPWIARMEHLEHRTWIEDGDSNALWKGKASSQRLLGTSSSSKMMQLAVRNFEFRRMVYKQELDEVKRWTDEHGLSKMGFAREKTSYLYFAIASSTMLSHDSLVRKILTKSAILVVVADDFFDLHGSLQELQLLTDALQNWDSKKLRGHSKTIFDALDNLLTDIAGEHFKQSGIDVTSKIQYIWYETLVSWLREASWSRTGHRPSVEEYVRNGMVSVAIHTMVLPTLYLLMPTVPNRYIKPGKYQPLTKLLMIACRLLNDFRGYKKEEEEGKLNSVLLYKEESSTATNIDDSVSHIQEIIEKKKKEFLELVFVDTNGNMPRSCRDLHLSCFRFYEMFYGSSNKFESDTALLQDIRKAIHDPLNVAMSVPKKIPTTTCSADVKIYGHVYPDCGPIKISKMNIRSTWYQNRRWSLRGNSHLGNLWACNAKVVLMSAPKFSFGGI